MIIRKNTQKSTNFSNIYRSIQQNQTQSNQIKIRPPPMHLIYLFPNYNNHQTTVQSVCSRFFYATRMVFNLRTSQHNTSHRGLLCVCCQLLLLKYSSSRSAYFLLELGMFFFLPISILRLIRLLLPRIGPHISIYTHMLFYI